MAAIAKALARPWVVAEDEKGEEDADALHVALRACPRVMTRRLSNLTPPVVNVEDAAPTDTAPARGAASAARGVVMRATAPRGAVVHIADAKAPVIVLPRSRLIGMVMRKGQPAAAALKKTMKDEEARRRRALD